MLLVFSVIALIRVGTGTPPDGERPALVLVQPVPHRLASQSFVTRLHPHAVHLLGLG